MNRKKSGIIIGIILISSIVSLFFFIEYFEFNRLSKIIAASTILVVSLILYLVNERKKKLDKANNIPIEDEFTLKSKVYAGNRAFHISMIGWLIIFITQDFFVDTRTMLGVGILGSALIYGICLWYYRYTQNFNNSNLQ